MPKDTCESCGADILVMSFRGTGACSVVCRKRLGRDVSSVGSMMFVTRDEKATITEARNAGSS
jgi:hypothetical protein